MRAHYDLREGWERSRDTALRDAFARRYRALVGVPVEEAESVPAAVEEATNVKMSEGIAGLPGED